MIYTVSLNPSIDYILRVDRFVEGDLNRAVYDKKIPGGKGIMVSKLLKNLGIDSVNIGFLGGFPGEFIRKEIEKLGIEENFTKVEEDTRINVKLKSQKESEINAQGPNISQREREEFLNIINSIKKGDMVILSGSIPKSLNRDFYIDIIKILKKNNVTFIIDTSGEVLLESLKYNPYLIKPNIHELSEVFDVDLKDYKEIIPYGKKCLELGSENVIVSMGKDGAMFFNKENIYYAPVVEGKLVNSVGAGDSMIGGFMTGISNNLSYKDSFKLAVASGTATAFSEDIGSREDIENIYKKVKIIELVGEEENGN